MHTVDLEEARSQLSDLMDAATKGEQVYNRIDDRTTVQLVPHSTPKRNRKFGSAKGRITLASDFDEPLEDLAEYPQ